MSVDLMALLRERARLAREGGMNGDAEIDDMLADEIEWLRASVRLGHPGRLRAEIANLAEIEARRAVRRLS